MARRQSRLVTDCDGCGKPFEPGERIDVVREAKVTGPYFSGGTDKSYMLMSKKPLAMFHKTCTPS